MIYEQSEVCDALLGHGLEGVVRRIRFEDDCWVWTGGTHESGYGRSWFKGRCRPTHRLVFEICGGVIPAGMHLDHLCRNPPCVNPLHLEPVTPKENARRGLNGPKSHCPRGHAYDAANTRLSTLGAKLCRRCHRDERKTKALKSIDVAGLVR